MPFVLVMLLLCVALWKDLANDPLVWRGRLARHVLEESVASGVDKHGGAFELSTSAPAENGEPESSAVRRRLPFWRSRRTRTKASGDHPAGRHEAGDAAPVGGSDSAPAPAEQDRTD